MNHAGVKYAVFPVFALHQGLSIVFESVRRRFGALIAYRQSEAVFHEHEIGMSSTGMDAPWLNISGDPKMFFKCIVSHGT